MCSLIPKNIGDKIIWINTKENIDKNNLEKENQKSSSKHEIHENYKSGQHLLHGGLLPDCEDVHRIILYLIKESIFNNKYCDWEKIKNDMVIEEVHVEEILNMYIMTNEGLEDVEQMIQKNVKDYKPYIKHKKGEALCSMDMTYLMNGLEKMGKDGLYISNECVPPYTTVLLTKLGVKKIKVYNVKIDPYLNDVFTDEKVNYLMKHLKNPKNLELFKEMSKYY